METLPTSFCLRPQHLPNSSHLDFSLFVTERKRDTEDSPLTMTPICWVFIVFNVGDVVAPRSVRKLTVTSVWPTTAGSSTAPEQRLRGQIPHSTNKKRSTAKARSLQHIIPSNSSEKNSLDILLASLLFISHHNPLLTVAKNNNM